MIGDLLYQLSPRDGGSPVIEIVHRHINSAGGSAQENADFQIPADKIFILQNATFNAHANAAVTPLLCALYTGEKIDPVPVLYPLKSLRTSSGGTGDDGVLDLAVAAGSSIGGNWQGQIIVPPNGFVRCGVTFDNVGVGNLATLNVHGLMLPRGNTMV